MTVSYTHLDVYKRQALVSVAAHVEMSKVAQDQLAWAAEAQMMLSLIHI